MHEENDELHIKYGTLAKPQQIARTTYDKDGKPITRSAIFKGPIEFHENGMIRFSVLEDNHEFDGEMYQGSTIILFNQDGSIAYGTKLI